jgi:tetratricopeptide (TPR) repeat protein
VVVSLLARRTVALVALTLLALPAQGEKRRPAATKLAPAKPPNNASEAEAQAHYQRALSYYNLREYEIAVLEFKEAYAISNEPLLLFNIGQAYRLDRQYEEALHYYRTFLQLRPRAPNRRDVEQFIAEMEQMLKTQAHLSREEPAGAATTEAEAPTELPAPQVEAPAAQEPSRSPSTTTTTTTSTTATTAPTVTKTNANVNATALTEKAPPKKPLRKQWWVWTAAGLGAAGIGLGLGLGLTLGRHEVLPSGSLGSIDARH